MGLDRGWARTPSLGAIGLDGGGARNRDEPIT